MRVRSSPPPGPGPHPDAGGKSDSRSYESYVATPDRQLDPASSALRSARAGPLPTDGVRLFRVVSRFTSHDENASASLEDCYTLEIESYSPDELYSMGLWPVRSPAPSMLGTA